MILAFDTHYLDDKAKTVMISFNDWTDNIPEDITTEITHGIAEYEPGSFYKRELPCILSLLDKTELEDVEAIIVDGFVILDDSEKVGLGGHLYEALGGRIPIIGVAKSGYHKNEKFVRKLFRGESKKSLYITAKGIELENAFNNIKSMYGDFRMPTLLQILDTKTKE